MNNIDLHIYSEKESRIVCTVNVFEKMTPFWKLLLIFILFIAWEKILFRRVTVPKYPNAYVNFFETL